MLPPYSAAQLTSDESTPASAHTSRPRRGPALCGLAAVLMLGVYYGAPLPQPGPTATIKQISDFATHYNTLLMVGGGLQVTGALLACVFFLGLIHLAHGMSRLAGLVALFGTATLLATALIEAVLGMATPIATSSGHPEAAVVCWIAQGVFIHVFPIGPAPMVFLAIGVLLVSPSPVIVLPRAVGYFALVLGVAFEVVGLLGLLVPAATAAIIVLLIAQEVWIAAASIVLLTRRTQTPGASRNE